MGALLDVGADMSSARQALTARNVGVTLTAAALVAAMAWLGLWQYGAYDDHQDADSDAALSRAPIPLDAALGPDSAFPTESVGRPVVVSGHYLPGEQFYVRGMAGGGRLAVATPMLTDSGAAIIVVRGSTPTPPVDSPAGMVRVEGVLEPSQGSAAPLGSDRVTDGIQIPRLVSDFDEDLYAGYLIATASDPPERLTPVPVPRPDASVWAGIRNLLYAIQWWSFAAFVVFMWWRIVSEPARRDDLGADDDATGADAVAAARHPDSEPA